MAETATPEAEADMAATAEAATAVASFAEAAASFAEAAASFAGLLPDLLRLRLLTGR